MEEKVIEATLTFAMAHPVATTVIAVTAISAYAIYKTVEKNSENNRKDEDRSVSTGNREGKIRNGN